jgi:hypothetical protein
LVKCIFYSAERSQLLDYNPSAGISAKGGKPTKKKEALTDEQAKQAFGNHQRASAVCIYHDRFVFGIAQRGDIWRCNGIVFFLMRLLHTFLCVEHGVLSITGR